ncbi:flagellar basal body P-ring formation chaperone FlgA [Chrysiogenes arsenatis]|uniref:flagellar basal body P-ring formation chaperone FlgA n=1 Tax=Chrysiogenes arsenatis TaxID=309797 RepID=UPI00040E6F41|nr:flagellar basal body P-ring formation chaperone FlgA [Chrysiogenes arsenatis]
MKWVLSFGIIFFVAISSWASFPVLQVLDAQQTPTQQVSIPTVPSQKHVGVIKDIIEQYVQQELGLLAGIERMQYRDDSVLRGKRLSVSGYINRSGVSMLDVRDEQGNHLEVRVTVLQRRVVYLPVRSFERGEVVTRDDFVEDVADARFQRQALDIDQMVFDDHVVATRPLSPGNVVRIGDLRRDHIVKRGDVVKVVYRNAGVTIAMSAIAQSNGYRGETITLKNTSTGKTLSARMTGRDHAEFIF